MKKNRFINTNSINASNEKSKSNKSYEIIYQKTSPKTTQENFCQPHFSISQKQSRQKQKIEHITNSSYNEKAPSTQPVDQFILQIHKLGLQLNQLPDSGHQINQHAFSSNNKLNKKNIFSFKDLQTPLQTPDYCIQLKNQFVQQEQFLEEQQQVTLSINSNYTTGFNANYQNSKSLISKLLQNKKRLHIKILSLLKQIKLIQSQKNQAQNQVQTLKKENTQLRTCLQIQRKKNFKNTGKIRKIQTAIIQEKQIAQLLNEKCKRYQAQNEVLVMKSRYHIPQHGSLSNITQQHSRKVQQIVNKMKKYQNVKKNNISDNLSCITEYKFKESTPNPNKSHIVRRTNESKITRIASRKKSYTQYGFQNKFDQCQNKNQSDQYIEYVEEVQRNKSKSGNILKNVSNLQNNHMNNYYCDKIQKINNQYLKNKRDQQKYKKIQKLMQIPNISRCSITNNISCQNFSKKKISFRNDHQKDNKSQICKINSKTTQKLENLLDQKKQAKKLNI